MVVYAIIAVVCGIYYGHLWYIFTGWQLNDVFYDFSCSVTAGRFEALYVTCGEAHDAYCYMTQSTVDRLAYLQAYDGLALEEALSITRYKALGGAGKVLLTTFKLLLGMAILYLIFRPVVLYFLAGFGVAYFYYLVKVYKGSLNPRLRITHFCFRLTDMAFRHTFGDDEAEVLLHPESALQE